MIILLQLCAFFRTAPRHPIQATRELFSNQWARFLFMGFCATAAYYILGLFFVTLLKLPLLVGNTAAFALSFAVSYFGHSLWTFRTDRTIGETLPKFTLTQLLAFFLNSFIIDTFCRRFNVPYPIAMIVVIIIVPAITFIICKFWIFRKKTS